MERVQETGVGSLDRTRGRRGSSWAVVNEWAGQHSEGLALGSTA